MTAYPYIFCLLYTSQRDHFSHAVMEEILGYWNRISNTGNMKILQYNFVELDDRVFGDYAAKNEAAFISQLRRLNELLRAACVSHPEVFLLDLQRIQNQLGRLNFYDPKPVSYTHLDVYKRQPPGPDRPLRERRRSVHESGIDLSGHRAVAR